MIEFIPGQRWISNTESELGLGLILDVNFNRVTVLYPASGERRVYARDNAPLTRVRFAVGDDIESADGEPLTVREVHEHESLIVYGGADASGGIVRLHEMELNHHLQFNKPQDRLFAGQFDPAGWFLLRYETWRRRRRLQQSRVTGLQGARIALIPHQLYIAHEAARRVAPRIMLADEVGLGKTIEAGLILHHRLLNGLSGRVLIIVPDSLMHQWLVEMLRRFSLRFSLFDEERCTESHADNPFLSEQLVLCGQGFFSQYPKRRQQALEAGWDIVVVDEAHHLEWNEQAPSEDYLFVERLSRSVPGVVLLTATPEQLGKESHFARLRLLDPDRFHSFEGFLEDEREFEPVAEISASLLGGVPLDEKKREKLKSLLQKEQADRLADRIDGSEAGAQAREELIKLLLDHHGTGRILFRNSRHTVKGFPERQRHAYPLRGEERPDDLRHDAYASWLVGKVKELGRDKALLICRRAETVVLLEAFLRTRHGIAAAIFHEGMSIVERDRAAAYFADEESSARLLICSEIGSEGRNFQFLHHLILFDLPDNPDLLQQRIGRLDRIGQLHRIQIHVPYLENSRQHVLYRWYDEGLDAFRHNSAGAGRVAQLLGEEFAAALSDPQTADIDALIDKTRRLDAQVEEMLQHGRDQLLELNSCRPDEAARLIELVTDRERDGSLWPYLEAVFDCFGVDVEFHSRDCHILRPSESLRIEHFPLLDDDGVTVTVDRDIALAREDMQFLTDEHPMTAAAMDLVLSSETGNAAVSVIRHPLLKPARFLLETVFVAECSAPSELQIGRFMPPTPLRVLIDQDKKNQTAAISHQSMIETGDTFDKAQISGFLNSQRSHLLEMIKTAEAEALRQMKELSAEAERQMIVTQTGEIKRLVRLKKINPGVREEEIEQLKEMTMLMHEAIKDTRLKLDAVRFVISN